jgi:hypothetical protein
VQTLYRGWIPAVTGRLSFSHFGDCNPRGSHGVSRTDGNTRYLLVQQKRKIWDVMLPAWRAFERALGLKGSVHFICIAETVDVGTDKQGALQGRGFIISDRKRWRKKAKAQFFEAISFLDDFEAFPVSGTIRDYFSKRAEILENVCGVNCGFQCRFSLRRSGVLDLTVDENDVRAEDAPQFPTDHRQHAVAAQVYSFLRDIGHRHQHHSNTSDTIIDLHSIEGGDDVEWRLKTLYGIYRRVISFKRQSDIAVQIQSVGLIAYAKAFKRIWLEDRPDAEELKEIPIYYDDAMTESIQASELRMRYKSQQSSERWSIFRTVTISLLGLILSFASIIKLSDSPAAKISAAPSPLLMWMAKQILFAPFEVVGISIAIMLFVVLARTTYFRPDQWRVFRYMYALMQPYGKRYVFSFFLIIGMVGIWAAYLLVMR